MNKRTLKNATGLLGVHLGVAFVALLFEFLLPFLAKHQTIYSTITTFVYITNIYSAGWAVGKKDARLIADFNPDMKRSIKIALLATSVSVIFFAVRVIAGVTLPRVWANINGTKMLIDNSGLVVINILYRFWFYFFVGFMGNGSFIGYLIPIFIIPIIYPIGYYAGIKKFNIIDRYMPKILYKNNKKVNKK